MNPVSPVYATGLLGGRNIYSVGRRRRGVSASVIRLCVTSQREVSLPLGTQGKPC